MKAYLFHAVIFLSLVASFALVLIAAYLPIFTVAKMTLMFGFMIVEASLIALFFMELRRATILVQIVASVGFTWLLIFIFLITTDYLTRGPGHLLGS